MSSKRFSLRSRIRLGFCARFSGGRRRGVWMILLSRRLLRWLRRWHLMRPLLALMGGCHWHRVALFGGEPFWVTGLSQDLHSCDLGDTWRCR